MICSKRKRTTGSGKKLDNKTKNYCPKCEVYLCGLVSRIFTPKQKFSYPISNCYMYIFASVRNSSNVHLYFVGQYIHSNKYLYQRIHCKNWMVTVTTTVVMFTVKLIHNHVVNSIVVTITTLLTVL